MIYYDSKISVTATDDELFHLAYHWNNSFPISKIANNNPNLVNVVLSIKKDNYKWVCPKKYKPKSQ